MRVEAYKLWLMPVPRFAFAAVLVSSIAVGIVLIAWSPASASQYTGVSSAVVLALTGLVATVLGVWSSTLEFGAGTLQRTLTAESDRNRVLLSKLAVLVVAAAALGVVGAATAGGLTDYATSRAGVYVDSGDLARLLFGGIPDIVASAVIGFGFGLLARSIGGGITVALAFIWVLSGLLSFAPPVSDLAYTRLVGDLDTHITGAAAADTQNGLVVSLVGVLVWVSVITVPGWIRFLRADLK